MDQLFRMPIKGRLNFKASDQSIINQHSIEHFSIFNSFYKFISNISRFLAYFISKHLFQSFHVSTIPFPVRFYNEIYFLFSLCIQFFSQLSIRSNFQSNFHLDFRKLSRNWRIYFSLEKKLDSTSFQFENTIISWHVPTFTNSHAFVCSRPKFNRNIFLAHPVGHIFVEHRYIFLFCRFNCAYSMVGHAFC